MTHYHRPETLRDALAVLAAGPVTVAAGCTDLLAATERPYLSGPVLDVTGIGALRGITETDAGWRFGATTTWLDILQTSLPPAFDMLKQAAREVGSPQIQAAGTLAGNLCNASPAADGVPPLLALDAQIEIAGQTGNRQLGLAQFLTGARTTVLAPGELVSAVIIPRSAGLGRSRFLKLGARRYMVISIAMVAVRLTIEQGIITRAALAIGACNAVAIRLSALEQAVAGGSVQAAIDAITPGTLAQVLAPLSDIRGDAAYRVEAATELLRRAVRQAGQSQ
ncbi:MAG: xanthine dehydrogenase family protein subunit M [Sedimentitalea sp.]